MARRRRREAHEPARSRSGGRSCSPRAERRPDRPKRPSATGWRGSRATGPSNVGAAPVPVRDERLEQLSVRVPIVAECVGGFLDRPAHQHSGSVVEWMCKCDGRLDPVQLEPERAEERRDRRAGMDGRADVVPKFRQRQLGGARPAADRGLRLEHAYRARPALARPGRRQLNTPEAIVIGAGPNGLAAAITLAQAGRSRTRVRGAAHGRRRDAHHRADAAWVPARRLLGDPSRRGGLAVLPLARARAGLARAGRRTCTSARRREQPCAGAQVGRRNRAHTRPRWGRVPKAVRGARRGLGRARSDVLGPVARLPRHPVALGRFGRSGLRSARGLASAPLRADPGSCASRRRCRPIHSCRSSNGQALVRARSTAARTRVGMAFPRGGSQASQTHSPNGFGRWEARSRRNTR